MACHVMSCHKLFSELLRLGACLCAVQRAPLILAALLGTSCASPSARSRLRGGRLWAEELSQAKD